jgi:hypothetical protein
MATTVYLLFATMHNTKESLEHFLLEGHHGGKEHHEESTFGFGMFLAMGVAIGTCCLASVVLRNHDNFVRCKFQVGWVGILKQKVLMALFFFF